MAASLQEATAPEDELVAAASQLRLDDVKVARSFCKVFAARARAAEAHGARAKAFGEWRRCTERAAPAAPASTTPRKRRRTPLKALENIQPTSGGKPRSARSPRSPQPASGGKSGRRSATKSPPRGTPHPYVPPPPPPESPAVASPRRVRWSPVAPAAATATPEKAAVRRDLFSRDAENDAAPAKEDPPLALPQGEVRLHVVSLGYWSVVRNSFNVWSHAEQPALVGAGDTVGADVGSGIKHISTEFQIASPTSDSASAPM